MVTDTYGDLEHWRSQRCVASLLAKNRISDGGRIDGAGDEERMSHQLSFTGRNATAEFVTLDIVVRMIPENSYIVNSIILEKLSIHVKSVERILRTTRRYSPNRLPENEFRNGCGLDF
ncbi:hypothetical protein EVAR_66124_1 [Eumeta japonica]|uniref:Uncharacterized protein n=1 Tax=Eumeta variegata TaxID=151549 RepID=A0A4C1ZU70_EUMVA|nr:hypothetical protein EVAR_66124_1 [Eumeta japonica]